MTDSILTLATRGKLEASDEKSEATFRMIEDLAREAAEDSERLERAAEHAVLLAAAEWHEEQEKDFLHAAEIARGMKGNSKWSRGPEQDAKYEAEAEMAEDDAGHHEESAAHFRAMIGEEE